MLKTPALPALTVSLVAGLASCRTGAALPTEPAPAAAVAEGGPTAPAAEGAELIGSPAPPWKLDHWMNSAPIELSSLRGRVVLVRWWTAPDCPLCAGTAPSLNALDRKYRDRGLVVVGVYHHKSDAPLRVEDVSGYKDSFGFKFPVAIDLDWQTLKSWWLDGHDRSFTSASFLIDRRGVFRYIHPGGKFAPGDRDCQEITRRVEALLAEPAPAPAPSPRGAESD